VRNNSYSITTTPMSSNYPLTMAMANTYTNNHHLLNPSTTVYQTSSMQQFLNSDIPLTSSISRSNSQPDLTQQQSAAAASINQLTSSKSMSVCSDDFHMDLNSSCVDDMFLGIEADFLHSDLSDFFEYDYFSDLNSFSAANDDTKSLQPQPPAAPPIVHPQRSAPASPKQQRKQQIKSKTSKPTTIWSKMSTEEQLNTSEELTRVINEQLGRREQLEIIRILQQPDVEQLEPHQTQFVLDFLTKMTDEKYRRIRNIIKFNVDDIRESAISETTSNSNKSDPTQEQRIERCLKLRQRKEQRQAMKEQKSGLFVKHEVMELTKCDEDIEVDILS